MTENLNLPESNSHGTNLQNEETTQTGGSENTEREASISESADQPVQNVEASESPALPDPVATSNAIQSSDYSIEGKPANSYRVSLPSVNLFTLNSKLHEYKKLNTDNPSKALKDWGEVVEEAVTYYTVGSLYQDRFTDPKSEFKQGIETKEGDLNSIGSVKFKKTEGELEGEIALLKVSKLLGLGDVIHVPLPHSGIWVTIKPPTEKALIDFYHSVFREKIMVGRTTYGLTLTNFSVHINNRLFDFILKHIHSVNFADIEKEELKNYVLIHDFPILAWAFGCTMYPNGFDYQRACINNLEDCTHITKATLNLTKLLWVDNKSLTEAQKLILAEHRPKRLTVESYRKHISEHLRVVGSSFTTSNGIKFYLKVPTFNEYTTDGLAWVNKINSSIENIILEETAEDDAKTEMLNQYVKTSILRQFNHFVDRIEFEDNVISDRATINDLLEAFSSEDEIRNQITENILKFKSDTTIALIGIPEYKCPNCNVNQNPDPVNDKFVNVIPLDTIGLLFLVLTSKISKILEREV